MLFGYNWGMKTGDRIVNANGVNATDIPVGAMVSYAHGVDGGSVDTCVCMREGKKVLGIPGVPFSRTGYPDLFYHGQNGIMTILSLPG